MQTPPAPEPAATQPVTTVALPAVRIAPRRPPSTAISNPSPPTVAAEQLPRVQGIIFNAVRPAAIVNGQTVYVGSRVGELR